MHRAIVVSILLIGLVCYQAANASECSLYQDGSYWIPNSLRSSGERFWCSAAWNDALLVCDNAGAHVLDFSGQGNPDVMATKEGVYYFVSVCGNIAALRGAIGTEIVSLPQLDQLSVVDSVGGCVKIYDETLVVAAQDFLYMYDISDPETPTLQSQVRICAEGEYLRVLHIAVQADYLVLSDLGGRPGMGCRDGHLIIVDISDRYHPMVTDSVHDIPHFDADNLCFFHRVVPHPPGFVVAGAAMDFQGWEYPYPYMSWLGRFLVDDQGRIEWCGFVDGDGDPGDVFVDGTNIVYGTSLKTYLIDGDWGLSELDVGFANLQILGNYCWAPEMGVLAADSRTYRIDDWHAVSAYQADVPRFQIFEVVEYPLAVGCQWAFADFAHGEPYPYSIRTFDVSVQPPILLDSEDGAVENISNIYIVGKRIYITGNTDYYYDVDENGVIGDRQIYRGETFSNALRWRDYVVALGEGHHLNVYTMSEESALDLVSSVPVNLTGKLTPVAESVYLSDEEGHVQIVDLNDPRQPRLVGDTFLRGDLKYSDAGILFQIDGNVLSWYRTVYGTHPQYLGTWNAGIAIYDVLLSGDRLYAAHGRNGVSVNRFDELSGVEPLGGDLSVRPIMLQHVEQGLLCGSMLPQILPLECGDPLPVTVNGFTATVSDQEVVVSWCVENLGYSEGTLRLKKTVGGQNHDLCEYSLENGCFFYRDDQVMLAGGTIYALEFCSGDAGCREVASEPVCLTGTADMIGEIVAYPNPANPAATIGFSTGVNGSSRLSLYSVNGRHIIDLLSEQLPIGNHQVSWDGRDKTGREVASGTYMVRLENGQSIRWGRLTLVR